MRWTVLWRKIELHNRLKKLASGALVYAFVQKLVLDDVEAVPLCSVCSKRLEHDQLFGVGRNVFTRTIAEVFNQPLQRSWKLDSSGCKNIVCPELEFLIGLVGDLRSDDEDV